MKDRMFMWIKKELVLVIASIAAIITMFFQVPSMNYFNYIDNRVLTLLFCLMAVVAGLQKNGVFKRMSVELLKGVKTTRSMCYILVMLCFLTSMWITNDVALITFIPFSILLLDIAGQNKYLIYVIVMQTIAANLGSMLTPVGNPQNLYLYSYYRIEGLNFMQITLPIVLMSFLIISVISLLVKREEIIIPKEQLKKMSSEKFSSQEKLHTVFYLFLFILCLGTVLHFLDYKVTLIIVILVIGIIDRKVLRRVDYSLLLTFISFFIFVGNLSNIDVVRLFISKLIQDREMISSILLSQIISNVPAAVLLSNFTSDGKSLILGTNIGGLGTIIASLASLISYRFYLITKNSKPLKYLGIFSAFNLVILFILYYFSRIIQ